MPDELSRQIPGNIPEGVIRKQNLDLGKLPQKIIANEFFECGLTGEASELYGELGPNLISCKLDGVTFPSGVSHFDAKDTIFLHSQVRNKFDRIMATQCAFRDVTFDRATFRDTAFVDTIFEGVTFTECNFTLATFKSNVFRGCSFLRCSTSNKLFEHCLFYDCRFESIILQEGSILQNYGIRLADCIDLSIYRAETGESLTIDKLDPKNRLESVSLAYFYGLNLNQSDELLEIVQFKLADATKTNILHIVTGIRQLTSFLLYLYSEGELLLYFVLQLFWSIDRFLSSYGENELPLNVIEALEISLARLRRVYEEVCLSIPPSHSYHLLIHEDYTESDLRRVIEELQLEAEVKSFRLMNSPSIAEIASPSSYDLLLFVTIVLSTRFRAEIDRYQTNRKLLDIGARLIDDGKSNPAVAYQALVALNVPKLLYVRLSASISLSILGRMRRMVIRFLENEFECSGAIRDEKNFTGMTPPVCILFLAANPPETMQLRLDKEIRGIDEALLSSGVREKFSIEQVWAVDEQDLQASLLRYKPDIVHLSAHGASSGRPILEQVSRDLGGTKSRTDPEVDALRGLAQVFAIAGRQLRCLLLNCCHSAKAAEEISKYADCIIGMSEAISDDAAIRFSWAFYNSLAHGYSIKASFDLGIAQLAISGLGESHIPQLFAGRVNPASVVLVRRARV